MIAPVQRKPTVKIAGYLEKRGKMRVVCRWKQWWFVLEGRLLLYYKSQLEYINLSPCRGSLNMGLASSVRPGKGLELQVVTRSQTVILRAGNRADHEQWLQAMLDAMTVQGSTNTFSSYPVLHFRYSNDVPFDRQDSIVNRIKYFGGRSYTLPITSNESEHMNVEEESNNHHGTDDRKNMANTESEEHLLKKKLSQSNERLSETKSNHLERNPMRNSLRRSKIGLSDTFIPERFQKENRLSDLSEQTSLSLNDLRKSFTCSNKDISKHDYIEIDYGFDKENEHNPDKDNSKKINSKHKHKLDTSKHEEQDHKTAEEIVESSVQTLKNLSQEISFNRNNTYQSVKKHNNKTDHQDKKILNPSISLHKDKYYFGLCPSKDVRSDTDLSVRKMSRPLSGSCGEIQKVNVYSESKLVEPAINSALVYDKKQILTETNKQNIPKVITSQISEKTGSKSRSNSLLCKGKECKTETEKGLERRGTLKKRSLSFLQRVWRKKEKKQEEQDYETVDYETIPSVIDVPPPPSYKIEPKKKPSPIEVRVPQNENAPEEPSPDYDTSLTEEIEKPPELPPRQKERPPSPWHDIPKNNAPIVLPIDEVPPALPAKTINRSIARRHDDDDNMYTLKHHHEWTLKRDHTLCYQSETTVKVNETVKVNDVKKLTNIDVLLAELSEVNFLATNEINKPCTWRTTCSVMANNNMEDRKNPDYDVPRPHASLLTTLRSQNLQSEAIPPTNFFCTMSHNERDSVGTTISRFSSEIDLEITPDSLECNVPLSMSGQVDDADFVWIPPTLHTTSTVGALQRHHYLFGDDRQYEDSLNT